MRSCRLLTLSPDNEPMWVRLYVHPVGDRWAAMLVADGVLPPEPGALEGIVCGARWEGEQAAAGQERVVWH